MPNLAWLERHAPEDVTAALLPFVSAERVHKVDAVLAARLAGVTVLLENLHDPHNGAAALRSIEAFGLTELHVAEGAGAFRFSPTVSQGCEKWVSILRHADFTTAARALEARGFTLAAALPDAPRTLSELDVSRPIALVFGNEHAGLTEPAQAACTESFSIPMPGFTRSFNLSVSVALTVADCAGRRRRELGGQGDLDAASRLRLRARWFALSLDARMAEGIVMRYQAERAG